MPLGSWTITQPLLSATETWENSALEEPTVLVDTNAGLFKMWFKGGWASGALGYATCPLASDPTVTANWTKYAGNPILGQGSGGVSGFVAGNSILKDTDGYHLWFYTGTNGDVDYSVSTDGITSWSTPATAIAEHQVAWSNGFSNTMVWTENAGSSYKMLVAGYTTTPANAICYATGSTIGGTFNVQGSGPLGSLQVAPTSPQVYGGPWLIGSPATDGRYRLFYHTRNAGIYTAWSLDAQLWTAQTKQLAPDGSTYNHDQSADPCVVEYGGNTYLFFSGVNNTSSISYINVAKFPGTVDVLFPPVIGGASS